MDCFFKIKQQYQNKRVLILGLGLQGGGITAVNFFSKIGSKIRVSDLKSKAQLKNSLKTLSAYPNLEFEFEKHSRKFIKWAEVIVRNPGVNLNSPALKLARKLNKEIILASAFFLKNCQVKTVGITGTRGKSTTTNLIYSILKNNLNNPIHLAGNLPQHSPFKLIEQIKSNDLAIMELSSWELQGFRDNGVAPNIAVLTNIYPDHLNYYDNMDDYIDDKMQILANQKNNDWFVTLESTYQQYQKQINNYLKAKLILVKPDYFKERPKYLLGTHNLENCSLAFKVGQLLKINDQQIIQAIINFPGLEFRLQKLGTIKQSLFFNDSTSTTPIAGIKAINTLKQNFNNKNIIFICGGKDKNLPFQDWLKIVENNCKQVFLLPGSFSDLVESKIKPKLTKVKDLETLFTKLIPLLNEQNIILFSPSATSFATFNNEFDRGEQFNKQFQINLTRYGA